MTFRAFYISLSNLVESLEVTVYGADRTPIYDDEVPLSKWIIQISLTWNAVLNASFRSKYKIGSYFHK